MYERAPRVRALDNEIKAAILEIARATFSRNGQGKLDDIQLKSLELQDQRRRELRNAGYPEDYLDDDYMCPTCHDTGFVGAGMCACMTELYRQAQRESLSSLFKLGDERFESFRLAYYDDTPAPGTGASPRECMRIILETCEGYARTFGVKSMNLFFNGSPGLGKTFLSACIARVVSENGHSVVYDTASSIFAKFENARFMRSDEQEEYRAEAKRCLECDLLIIDDLGTEMKTAFTVAALYEIINTRLLSGNKTIVSSNLAPRELSGRYSEQIMSRLEGEYEVLTFRGDDIRKKRNTT